MKPKMGSVLIGLILAVVATVLVIAIPSSANLYVAYVFCLLGIAALVAGVFAADAKNMPATYAVEWQTGWFLPVSVLVSTAVLLLQGYGIYTLPVVWHAIFHFILFAIVGIRLISIFIGKEYIQKIDQKVAVQTGRMGNLVADVNALQSRIGMMPEEQRIEARKAIQKVAEALRYSDPMSMSAVYELDAKIENSVQRLAAMCSAGKADGLVDMCDAICEKIRERNERLKLGK